MICRPWPCPARSFHGESRDAPTPPRPHRSFADRFDRFVATATGRHSPGTYLFCLRERPGESVRRMGIKENFTHEAWENLVSLPYAVSMTVMMAAPNMLGIWGETKAMMQQPADLAAASGSSLVGLLVAETQARARDLIAEQQTAWRNDQGGYRAKTLEACRSAATALANVPPEEAEACKSWVMAIGMKVAEASKEGGVAVSEPEKAALAEIAGALGVGAP